MGMRAQPGSVSNPAASLKKEDDIRSALVQYYNKEKPQVAFRNQERPGEFPLHPYAETYNYALLDGRRIMPTSTRNSEGSSIIQARFGNEAQAGEIKKIFVHHQSGVQDTDFTLLAAVKWMKNSPFTPLDNTRLWDAL